MKIAICSVQEFNPMIGGIERVSVSLASELVSLGHEVVFVSCRKSPYGKSYSLPAEQFTLPSPDDYAVENVKALCEILAREQVDVVLNQNAHSEAYNRMIAEVRHRSGVPVVSALHFDPMNRIASNRHLIDSRFNTLRQNVVGAMKMTATTWPFTLLSMKSQRRMLKNLYLNSDAVVLLSEKYIPSYKKLSGIKGCQNLYAINNMLSWPLSQKVLYEKKNIILFVGRLLHSQKRPEQILKAWLEIQDELKTWKVVFVGDGPDRHSMENYSRGLGLKRVFFEGFKNPQKYYEESAVFVMTSSHEGWPLTLSEAMQYGCVPVVYNTFSSVTDQISDGEDGCLVKPFDVDELARKILMLARNDGLRMQMSEKAVKSRSRFTPKAIAAEWERVFSGVISENGKEKK